MVNVPRLSVRCYRNAEQRINSGQVTKVQVNTVEFDTDNMFDAANQRIVFNTGGTYLIVGQVMFASNITGRRFVDIGINGGKPIATASQPPVETGGFTRLSVSTLWDCSPGDYAELKVHHTAIDAAAVPPNSILLKHEAPHAPAFMAARVA